MYYNRNILLCIHIGRKRARARSSDAISISRMRTFILYGIVIHVDHHLHCGDCCVGSTVASQRLVKFNV